MRFAAILYDRIALRLREREDCFCLLRTFVFRSAREQFSRYSCILRDLRSDRLRIVRPLQLVVFLLERFRFFHNFIQMQANRFTNIRTNEYGIITSSNSSFSNKNPGSSLLAK